MSDAFIARASGGRGGYRRIHTDTDCSYFPDNYREATDAEIVKHPTCAYCDGDVPQQDNNDDWSYYNALTQ